MRYLPTHRYVLLKLQSHKYKSSNRHTGHTDDVRSDGQSITTRCRINESKAIEIKVVCIELHHHNNANNNYDSGIILDALAKLQPQPWD